VRAHCSKLRGADSDYAPSTCANINTHLASVTAAPCGFPFGGRSKSHVTR
jgi:hypothetical protein